MFKIKAKKNTLKFLRKLSKGKRSKVKEVIAVLKSDPIPFRRLDVVKLRGHENIYRIRIGNLRIIYEVNWEDRIIVIHFIGSRKKAYR